jgi:hypothetical protein
MLETNPYACPRATSRRRRSRRPWNTALAASLGLFVMATAARHYMTAATSLPGIVAGSLLVVVAVVVGRIIAAVPGARLVLLLLSGAFATALSGGWIDHAGGELTMWAFSCMCAGLLAGAASPVPRVAQDSDLPSPATPETSERRS